MAIEKTKKRKAGKSPSKVNNTEKIISFWKKHSVDMSSFQFDREEANSR